jgi:hypothetical protein
VILVQAILISLDCRKPMESQLAEITQPFSNQALRGKLQNNDFEEMPMVPSVTERCPVARPANDIRPPFRVRTSFSAKAKWVI